MFILHMVTYIATMLHVLYMYILYPLMSDLSEIMVILCCVVLRYVTLRYVTLRYVTLC